MSEATPIDLPVGLRWVKLVCRLGRLVTDSAYDADPHPDLLPVGGELTLTASPSRVRVREADGRWRSVEVAGRQYNIRADGELVDGEGRIGVYIPDPISPLVEPQGYAITAVVKPTAGTGWNVTIGGDTVLPDVVDLVAMSSVGSVSPSVTASFDSRLYSLETGLGFDVVEAVEDYLDTVETAADEAAAEAVAARDTATDAASTATGAASTATAARDATLAASTIVGAGRPDVPASMTTEVAALVAAATSGAEYRSTDGAGVGAWVWMKRPTGWKVVDGDTGWRRLNKPTGATRGSLSIRRIGAVVYVEIADIDAVPGSTWGVDEWPLLGFLPVFRINSPLMVGSGSVIGALDVRRTSFLIACSGSANFSQGSSGYSTPDPWPTTLPGTPV